MSVTPEDTLNSTTASQSRRGSAGTGSLAIDSLKDGRSSSCVSVEEEAAMDRSSMQERRSSGQGVRLGKPLQKSVRKPGCGTKRRRKRLERLVVLYGPDLEFQKELLDKTMEKYSDNFVLPPMVTTMPADHPHIAAASPAHKFVHVTIQDFEKMFVDKELLCHYHVLKGSNPCEVTPATEGECTSASNTEELRSPKHDCLGIEDEPLTLPPGSAPGVMAVLKNDKDNGDQSTKSDPTVNGTSPNHDDATPSEEPSTPSTPTCSKVDDRDDEVRNLGTPRLSHPTLYHTKSAPSGLDHKKLALSIRHTFYFGYQEKMIRAKLQESSGGVVTLLLPPEPAAQIYSWCRGRFPNAFISTDDSDNIEVLLRPDNTSIKQVDDDSMELLHEIFDSVLTAQRFDVMSYAEALAYFQSRQFLLERKAAGGVTSDKKPILNVSKIRLDRSLKAERDLVATVSGCAYNPEDPVHMRISRTIFSTMTNFGGSCPATGRHWAKLGCLPDSAPETSRAGLLAYMHVLHLMATDGLHSLLDDIFRLSLGGEKFKFMEVSLRLSQSVLLAMQSSYMQKLCNQRQQIFGVLNDLYVGGLLKFFEIFKCAVTPPDINAILNDVDHDIRNHSRRIMLSVENHFQGYSFHAQVTGPLSVLRSTSLTSVNTVQNNDSEDATTPMSQPVTPSLSNSTAKVGLFGRSSSSSLMHPESRTPSSKSASSLKFI